MVSEDASIGPEVTAPRIVEESPSPVETTDEQREDDLSGLDEAEETVEVETVARSSVEVEDSAVPAVADQVLTLECRIRVEDLPESLRAALAEVDASDLELAAEIVLKTDA
jgi:hypothetical protein